MKQIGVSYYPDFHDNMTCERFLSFAYKIGYRVIFTSLILNSYGFANTEKGITEKTMFFLGKAKELGFEVRADITREVLYALGGRIDDLTLFNDLNISVLRLDGGFNDEEVVELTLNRSKVKIEDNLSNYRNLEKRLELIYLNGNIRNYCTCHNFYPRVGTGISLDDAVNAALMFKKYGVETGIFIGSLASEPDLNDRGQSIVTVENHRYIPSEIQLIELLCLEVFDTIIFGDSLPSDRELENVASTFTKYFEHATPLIEIPCYFENISKCDLETLTMIEFSQRLDKSEFVIRGCESRGLILQNKENIVRRVTGTITIDNTKSHQYVGEMQISLVDQSPLLEANVVGIVKPYAIQLLKYLNNENIKFKLSR